MEQIEGSETSASKPQTPGKYPKENILRKQNGEILKSRNVEFDSKNKFEKLVHLVGSIIRIYQDARSPERQIRYTHFPSTIFVTVFFSGLDIYLPLLALYRSPILDEAHFTCSRITFSVIYTGTAFINYSTWDGRSEHHNLNIYVTFGAGIFF